ncbi:hypothetical protein AXK11_06590 [Cephaloticoccus primus]|uniref:Ysc84 actin-binding domain-containing protein n=1 Tax=Cephaloticoccus primus TaxID=1548207 RepID=A0A139SLL7_9BACT|nr:lipid-binding SYLF domain-containing protein [Cephaloticoccus primus]KXU35442.1 hypothetical protein AXK11_06590 [Cephaloticoccus primus]
MKTPSFLLLLLALFFVAPFGSLHAASPKRDDYVRRVETCEAILQEFMASPDHAIPREVLKHAKGLIIVNQFSAGFLFGVKDGWGVIMVRRADGSWSVPALLTAGEGSLGLQLGASANETIFVLNDESTPRLLFKGRFHIGADAKAVAGPKSAANEYTLADAIAQPILVYSKNRGLYAGAAFKAGYLSSNDQANHSLYSTQYSLPEILYSNWVTPAEEVRPLMNYVNSLTGGQ